MKKNNLNKKFTEDLKSELTSLKIITGALAVILTVLFIVNLYGLLWKDNNAAFIAGISVAIALGAILPLQFSNMKKIKSELNTRNTND